MNLFKPFALAIMAMLAAPMPAAFATCTKPSGTYVGSGAGFVINSSGTTTNYFSTTLSATLATSGAGTLTEKGKSYYYSGRYSATASVTAANNVFNTTTCTGTLTSTEGTTFLYTSSGSGAKITFQYYNNDGVVYVYNFSLDKV